jgi:alpha-ketoglutarate-dependent taurine dioxygenase
MLHDRASDMCPPDLQRRRDEARSRFRSTARHGVRIDSETLVRKQYSSASTAPPVTIEPVAAGVDLPEWAANHCDAIRDELRNVGAVLFRGFRVGSAEAFEPVARVLCGELYSEYGDLPGATPGAQVYKSTPYPEDRTILFHNESSHLSSWPKTMCFCCVQASPEGGETPVADCRAIYQRLPADLREAFERKGLLYVRNFIPGLDVSWRAFFRTDDRAVVEAYCRQAGMTCDWWGDDCLRTTQFRPAVVTHPDTGEKTFFNQILLHHLSCLEQVERETLRATFDDEQFPRSARFGDGSPIPDAVVAEVLALTIDVSRVFAWEAGDLLLVDNMLVSHSRNPYRGPRRILVAMGEMVNQK